MKRTLSFRPLWRIEHGFLYHSALGLVPILTELSWLVIYILKYHLVVNEGLGSNRCSAHVRGGQKAGLLIIIIIINIR